VHEWKTSQVFVKLYHKRFWNLVLVSLLLPGLRETAPLCYTSYMPDFAAPVERLIDELKHLPGIGQKTAQRLAFHLLRIAPEDALALADAIRDAKEKIRTCSTCHNITDSDPCLYCAGANRNKRTICVVEEPHNILAIEKTRTFNGMYHVLGGSLSPLQGRGPEQLNIKTLIERLKGGTVEEIIIATNPTAEGEATAVYLSKLLKPLGVRVTRIGVGIPVGADLEYADEVTMLKAMEGRREL
jgi:recombination protein RecR